MGVHTPNDHVWDLYRYHEVSLSHSLSSNHLASFRSDFVVHSDVTQKCARLRFNSRIMVFVTHKLRSARPCCHVSEGHRDVKMGEDASACNTSMVLINKGQKIREQLHFYVALYLKRANVAH